ncbi:hypothetical protein [Spirosoma oryzicola]|uniref:hypothetical protein n=1 Tax=Spirosoma oryzicola TaxID=2898794 RepID=UPI001E49E1D8|nr:hypothetical protein [Spirosoma oryzicola]UHG89799.1 hypothetical protein LQ777_16275 [Spirosoma oryzicola]
MTNIYIRQIASTVDIDKDVTTDTARHSFSTVLKRRLSLSVSAWVIRNPDD